MSFLITHLISGMSVGTIVVTTSRRSAVCPPHLHARSSVYECECACKKARERACGYSCGRTHAYLALFFGVTIDLAPHLVIPCTWEA
jgi:hypothetical protein